MQKRSVMSVGGACTGAPLQLGVEELRSLPERHQVPDVGVLAPGRRGTAVRFQGLVERVAPSSGARFVHVASADGAFTASLELARLEAHGVVLYALGDGPLPADAGGPFRLLLLEADDCSVNVKSLARIDFSSEPGPHSARCAASADA